MATVTEKRNGRLFIRVKTKRGPRARQVTAEGEAWLRARLPSFESTFIDRDTYNELWSRGYIYTKGSQHRRQGELFPTSSTTRQATPNYRPSPRVHVTSTCSRCRKDVSEQATFCSHCGQRLDGATQPIVSPPAHVSRPSSYTEYNLAGSSAAREAPRESAGGNTGILIVIAALVLAAVLFALHGLTGR